MTSIAHDPKYAKLNSATYVPSLASVTGVSATDSLKFETSTASAWIVALSPPAMSWFPNSSLETTVTTCATPAVASGNESEVAAQFAGDTAPGAMDVATSDTSVSPRVTRMAIEPETFVFNVARYRPGLSVPTSFATRHLA